MLRKKGLSGMFLLAGVGGMIFSLTSAGIGAKGMEDFAGSEKCATCHKSEYDSWRQTLHAKIILPKKEGLLKEAGDQWAADKKGNPGPAKGNVDGKSYSMDDVVLVNGTQWKQRYLVKNPATGSHQFLDKQWNAVHQVWEGYNNKSDWETKCATCHTTGYVLQSYDKANPSSQKAAFAEMNIGCEACHGPAAGHAKSGGKEAVFNPAKATKEEASQVCGYCHVRKEDYVFLSSQGEPREDQVHPTVGETYKAGKDDWRTWVTYRTLVPGSSPMQPISQNYPKTGLDKAFQLDDKARAWQSYDATKHHEQWQEFIQSAHYQKNVMSCSGCHSPHAMKNKPAMKAKASCTSCHGDKYSVEKTMPGTGGTAGNLFMRTHTFNPKQDRTGGPTADGREVRYYYSK